MIKIEVLNQMILEPYLESNILFPRLAQLFPRLAQLVLGHECVICAHLYVGFQYFWLKIVIQIYHKLT